MADDKRTDNGKHDDKRAEDRRVEDRRTERAVEQRHDDRKNGGAKAAPEDMTPVPTQAELDDIKGGKDRKVEKRETKPAEDLTPTPTQAEADEQKAALFNTTVEEDKKRNEEYRKRATATGMGAKEGEDLTPTPTQAENDQAKLDAMYVPEGAGDPQKVDPQRRTIEASKPGGYQTRSGEAARPE